MNCVLSYRNLPTMLRCVMPVGLRRIMCPLSTFVPEGLMAICSAFQQLEFLCCGLTVLLSSKEMRGRKFSSLKTLHLGLANNVPNIDSILACFGSVEEFSLTAYDHLEDFKSMHLPWDTLKRVRVGKIRSCNIISFSSPDQLDSFSTSLPTLLHLPDFSNLEHLALFGVGRTSTAKIAAAVRKSSQNIRSLTLHFPACNKGGVLLDDLTWLLETATNVTSISLTSMDGSLCKLLCKLKMLEELILFSPCCHRYILCVAAHCSVPNGGSLRKIKFVVERMTVDMGTMEMCQMVGVVIVKGHPSTKCC